jgi:hypothetical protein
MEICDVHNSCVLFNNELTELKSTAKIMKSSYCFTNFSKCICYEHSQERLMVSVKGFYPTSRDS